MSRAKTISRRRGTVLLVVLVLTAMAGVLAAGLLFRMSAEVGAGAGTARMRQAREAATSGVQRALAVLARSQGDVNAWRDNGDLFRNQLVVDDGVDRWYFTVYAPSDADAEGVRYGLTDLSGRINLNVADADTLARLPHMTPERVDALLDWRDRDDETRPYGAEQDAYDRLAIPYLARNGPLAGVEELLLVLGFDARAVYGEDANLNGLLEPNEDDGDESFPFGDDGDGVLDRGLRAVACALSHEPDVDSDGSPRIDLNEASDEDMRLAGLGRETVEFVRRVRDDGGSFSHAAELLEMRYQLTKDVPDRPDLRAGTWVESPVDADELATLLDRFTAGGGVGGGRMRWRVGLVNVNTAPRAVLEAVEGLDAEAADEIVDVRGALDAGSKSTIAWLYAQNVLDAEAFKQVASRLTARGYQFRVQCVGFGHPCGQFAVVEAVINLAGRTPRVVYLRELTRLGMPFALEAGSLESR